MLAAHEKRVLRWIGEQEVRVNEELIERKTRGDRVVMSRDVRHRLTIGQIDDVDRLEGRGCRVGVDLRHPTAGDFILGFNNRRCPLLILRSHLFGRGDRVNRLIRAVIYWVGVQIVMWMIQPAGIVNR